MDKKEFALEFMYEAAVISRQLSFKIWMDKRGDITHNDVRIYSKVIGTFMDCIHNMPEEIQEDKGRDLIGLGVDILLEKDLQEELKGLFIRDVHTEEKIMRLIEKAETYANNYK